MGCVISSATIISQTHISLSARSFIILRRVESPSALKKRSLDLKSVSSSRFFPDCLSSPAYLSALSASHIPDETSRRNLAFVTLTVLRMSESPQLLRARKRFSISLSHQSRSHGRGDWSHGSFRYPVCNGPGRLRPSLCVVVSFLDPESHVHQADQDRHLNQRSDDGGESYQ